LDPSFSPCARYRLGPTSGADSHERHRVQSPLAGGHIGLPEWLHAELNDESNHKNLGAIVQARRNGAHERDRNPTWPTGRKGNTEQQVRIQNSADHDREHD
jgi:hypothetical protein